MDSTSWKERLAEHIPGQLREEIDVFEMQLQLRQTGKLDESVFAETRLRRGVYGQRYDNGRRHDGTAERQLELDRQRPTKGPSTLWDAPGMVRIKIPGGALNAAQLEVIAELAEEYADGISHATTRQDIQLHYVHIDDTPDLMRRLAAVGITTREACGNGVRNVTACPVAGVCSGEVYDVMPYARACAQFLLGHADAQDFGRKFKIAFSGCAGEGCGLAKMHDLGFVARTREQDGREQRGFEIYVGGGLGAVPHQAKLFDQFLPVEEMLPIAQAICRVFSHLGEKRNRARARVKFLVAKLGIDEFRRLVLEERQALATDPRWTAFLARLDQHEERPARPAKALEPQIAQSPEFVAWRRTNVRAQKQLHRHVVTVTLPLGDATSDQFRALADITREYCGHDQVLRVTVDQNIVMRWVSESDLPALYRCLVAARLGQAGAGTIADVTACPGTDTCKLGIAASRGLARQLRQELSARSEQLHEAVEQLHIKISGCFNSCGQHHVADIGFYGVSRKVGNYAVPHFQVVIGGRWKDNAGAYGLAIAAVPSKRIPEVVNLLAERYVEQRRPEESFADFVARVGKATVKSWLSPLCPVPTHAEDPSFYSDWGDPREFTTGDIGVGECAGQVVSSADFELADAERITFEAQLKLDDRDPRQAANLAYLAMLQAANALVRAGGGTVGQSPDEIVSAFRARLYDTKLFFDPYAGGKFAQYLFSSHGDSSAQISTDGARQRVEEAQLFIEAAHACHARMGQS